MTETPSRPSGSNDSPKTSPVEYFKDKTVLVTGGTGSVGSEIVRRLLTCSPTVVRVLSRDETKQYYLQQELGERDDVRYLIGDVRDEARLKRAMSGVDVVFHAAALKHVPSCEYNPFEAVQTNVAGTQNVIQAAIDANVSKVIAVSTDKAVNPVNVMGATKLLSEKLIATANNWTKQVKFGCVRFGNVLGSRGSLVPTVIQQIRQGGPVTITDPRMTRFMMSVREAIDLCLEAAALCQGSEVYILKMPALWVGDLIDVIMEQVAPLYGLAPDDIDMKVVGIRPGEKVDEELLSVEESVRTEELDRMFVVYSGQKWSRMGRPPAQIDRRKYQSCEAEPLSPDEIKTMLRQADIINHRTLSDPLL